HRTAAIFALGDRALKRRVIDRVVLDVDGEPLLVRIQARAARNRPAPQHAGMFKAQIVVQSCRRMFVDDEYAAALLLRPRLLGLGGGFGGFGEIALGAVLFEGVSHYGESITLC